MKRTRGDQALHQVQSLADADNLADFRDSGSHTHDHEMLRILKVTPWRNCVQNLPAHLLLANWASQRTSRSTPAISPIWLKPLKQDKARDFQSRRRAEDRRPRPLVPCRLCCEERARQTSGPASQHLHAAGSGIRIKLDGDVVHRRAATQSQPRPRRNRSVRKWFHSSGRS